MSIVDIFVSSNFFAFNTDFIKENSRSIYSMGMYGNIYRIEKATRKMYKDGKYMGIAQYYRVI